MRDTAGEAAYLAVTETEVLGRRGHEVGGAVVAGSEPLAQAEVAVGVEALGIRVHLRAPHLLAADGDACADGELEAVGEGDGLGGFAVHGGCIQC